MLNHLRFIALSFLISSSAFADQYSYSGASLTCNVWATRSSIGHAETQIGESTQRYSFQVFKSEVYAPRFTAFNSGSIAASQEFIDGAGIPNLFADMNWNVMDNNTSFIGEFQLPDGTNVPVTFSLKEAAYTKSASPGYNTNYNYGTPPTKKYVHYIKMEMDLRLDDSIARNILVALGDVNTPDFLSDPPIVSPVLYNYSGAADTAPLAWGNNVTLIKHYQSEYEPLPPAGYPNARLYTKIQLHYPAEKYNGLSYHISILCSR